MELLRRGPDWEERMLDAVPLVLPAAVVPARLAALGCGPLADMGILQHQSLG